MKECTICKITKNLTDFYSSKRNNKIQYYSECKKCSNKRTVQQLRDKKKKAVEYLGGKCLDCGLVDLPIVYDFHHRNPKEKDFQISRFRNFTWNKIKTELDKCDLLCSNCHRKRHFS